MSPITLLILIIVAVILLTGVLLAATPWLMRKRECFAVTIPESAQSDPRFNAFRVRYAVLSLAVTVVCSVAAGVSTWVFSAQAADTASSEALFTVMLLVAALAPSVASFAAMLHYRKKVQAIKKEEGWKAERAETVAFVGREEEVPKPPSFAWNLVYLPIILATLAIGAMLLSSAPDMVAAHIDLTGEVDEWMPSGPALVAFPVALEAFLGLCFAFSHWTVLRAKKDVDPSRPAVSAYAYGAFARAQSLLLVVGGALYTAILGFTALLFFMDLMDPGVELAIIVGSTLVLLAASVAVSLAYGQSGSRLVKRLSEQDGMPADDDALWKLGVFYFNKDDASMFVPARFGVGWTLNWARPSAWAAVVTFTLVTVAFVVGCNVLL